MTERITTFTCALCGRPVHLAECKVNEMGEPVHETCLMERMKEERKKVAKQQT